MSDAEILSDRLAATEAAVLQIDERLDVEEAAGEPESPVEASLETRLAEIEGRLNECLATLQVMQNSTSSNVELEIARVEAEAEVEVARVEAEAAVAMVAAAAEPETEMEVEEIAPEPESESEAAPAKQREPNFLEKLLTLR